MDRRALGPLIAGWSSLADADDIMAVTVCHERVLRLSEEGQGLRRRLWAECCDAKTHVPIAGHRPKARQGQAMM